MPQSDKDRVKAFLNTLSPEERRSVDLMDVEQRRNFVRSRMFDAPAVPLAEEPTVSDPTPSLPDMGTAPGILAAHKQGLLPEHKLPIKGVADFTARILAGMSSDPTEQSNLLKKGGYKPALLPSGKLLIENNDGVSFSQLDEKGFGVGDIADVSGNILPVALGTAGAIIGSAGIATSALGAMAGVSAGRFANEYIAGLLGSGTSIETMFDRTATEGLLEGSLAFLTGGASRVLKFIGARPMLKHFSNPLGSTVNPKGVAVRPLFQAHGSDLPITGLNDSKALQITNSILRRRFSSTDIIEKDEAAAIKTIDKIVRHFSTQHGGLKLDPADAGAIGKDGFNLAKSAFIGEKSQRFEAISRSIGDEVVTTENYIKALEEILKSEGLLSDSGVLLRPIRGVTPDKLGGIQTLYRRILDGEVLSYDKMKIRRTQIRSGKPGPADPVSTTVRSQYGKLEHALSEDMMQNAERIGLKRDDPNLLKNIVETNQWYKRQLEILNGPVGKILENSRPENVAEKLFKAGQVTNIKELREILPKPWVDILGRQWLDKVYDKSIKEGALDVKSMNRELRRVGDPMLKEMFPDTFAEVKQMHMAFEVLETAGKDILNLPDNTALTLLRGLLTQPINTAYKLYGPRKLANIITSEKAKDFAVAGSTDPIVQTINKILKPISTGATAAADATRRGIRGTPLLSQILSTPQTNLIDQQEQ